MFSVIINAKFAIVASLLCQYFPISVVLLYSKKLIQKRLNISIHSTEQNGHFVDSYRTNIPQNARFGIRNFQTFPVVTPWTSVRHPPMTQIGTRDP